MVASKQECRWRFHEAVVSGDSLAVQAAWETSCDQWCIDSECSPSRDGFRNGFCFCPYCGGPLVLVLNNREERAA